MKKIALVIIVSLVILLVLGVGIFLFNNKSELGTSGSHFPPGCNSSEECATFCAANHETCDKFCADNPGNCPANASQKPENTGAPAGAGGPMANTECANTGVVAKMKAVVDNALVNPPAKIENLNWMTKILPMGNPYPGYYYDISTAFGPAIDEIIGTAWNGQGEPPMAPGKFHYSFGYWDEVPKGKGATLGAESPQTIDFSKYMLAIFYTNYTGSQDKMISSLPVLSMSESEAKTFFYSVFKKSFINLDSKTLEKKGSLFYEASWKDSDKSSDYWDVQIGENYIAIGQGKVYSDESALAGNVGTIWIYHACKPCVNCDNWAAGISLNHDCNTNADCQSGLSCSGGYCIQGTSSSPSQQGQGAPGSSCTSDSECSSGLSCKNSVCSIPMGP